MRVEWTDEQEFLREAVAGVVTREAPFSTVRGWADDGDLAAADALAARQGWTGIGLDEAHGGQGGGPLELAVLAEELGRGAVPWDRTLAGCLAAPLLARAGGDEALALAASTAEGDAVAVLAVDGRRPLAAGGGDDDVRLVPGAPGASTLVVPVAHGDEVELLALSGAAVRPRTLVDRTRALADVELGGAQTRSLGTVPAEALRTAAATAAVLVAADALGAAGRLLALTTQYIGERRQFGVPVGSFQAVKHAAAEMLVDVEASRSAVMHAAWAVGAGEDDAGAQASVAKSVACSAAARVADRALFLHGAVGYTWEHDLQFPFKRTKSDALVFGSPDAHRDLIAAALGLVRDVQPVG
jgi:alkylation response protein AidB-like acyl-CoA dehydrogenase